MKYITIGLLAVLLGSCVSKENNANWDVLENGVVPNGDHLVLVHESDYSEIRPYELGQGSDNIVWEEDQILPSSFLRKEEYIKQIVLEIPDSTGLTAFYYEDETIFDSMKCSVYQWYSSKHDGYYRIHKGFISGEKVGMDWEINFEVFYGGESNDKYRMVRGADY